MQTDVLILGKGIAGLTLGFLLKQKGIDCILLDRVDKRKSFALAETLPPSAMPLLQELGIMPIFEKHAIQKTFGYHSSWGNEQIADHNFFHHPQYKNGLKINKQAIIDDLSTRLNTSCFPYDYLETISLTATDVTISVRHEKVSTTIKSQLIIDATGRNRVLIKAFNIPIETHDSLLAFGCHLPKIKHPKLVHEVFVESFEHGWGIVSGLNATTNVCTLFTHKGSAIQKELRNYNTWKSIVSETNYLKDFLVAVDAVKIHGTKANSSKPAQLSGKNWLTIGDAALAFDPLSSHGITNTIYTTKIAALAIEKYLSGEEMYKFQDYANTLTSIFDAYLQTKHTLYSSEKRWENSTFWEVLSTPKSNEKILL